MTDKEAADRLRRRAGTEVPGHPWRETLLAGADALEERIAWAQREVLRPSEVSAMVKRLQEERDRMKAAVLATAAYFDALSKWSDENQSSDKDTHCIPAGSQPVLDETLSAAIEAVSKVVKP